MKRIWNRFRAYITKPQNAILLALGIILTFTTIFPMYTIVRDTVRLHPGSIDSQEISSGVGSGGSVGSVGSTHGNQFSEFLNAHKCR